MTSLRFGPHPPDLVLADPSGREYRTSRTEADFQIVRFRLAGRWTLGVLRGWRRSRDGVIVRIETLDRTSAEPKALWYRFVPDAIDPVQVETRTGELRLVPPWERIGGDRRSRRA